MSRIGDLIDRATFHNNSPLDQFFDALNADFLLNDQWARINDLSNRLQEYLEQLNTLLQNSQSTFSNELIPVSLNDLRLLNKLVDIIVQCEYESQLPHKLRYSFNEEIASIVPVRQASTLEAFNSFVIRLLSVSQTYLKSVIINGPLYYYVFWAELNLHRDANLELLESLQETYSLFQMYTYFISQKASDSALNQLVSQRLATLHLRRRDNGVVSLIDFILRVRENESIELDKIDQFISLVMTKPKNYTNVQYLTELFEQVYSGLQMINKPIIVNCLDALVTRFHQRNPKIVKDFLFRRLDRVIFNDTACYIGPSELNNSINVLVSLTKSSSPELIKSLVTNHGDARDFYLNLWAYCMFLKKNQTLDLTVTKESQLSSVQSAYYYEVILSLINALMLITNQYDVALPVISSNLLGFESHEHWRYLIDFETHLPYIDGRPDEISDNFSKKLVIDINKKESKPAVDLLTDMDMFIDLFVSLLKITNNDEVVANMFLSVLNRWIISTKKATQSTTSLHFNEDKNSRHIKTLLDLKLLDKFNSEFESDIIKNYKQVLKLVEELLDIIDFGEADDTDSDDEDDVAGEESILKIILQLLKTVLNTNIHLNLHAEDEQVLKSIGSKLAPNTSTNALCSEIYTLLQDVISREERDGQGDADSNAESNRQRHQELLSRALVNIADPLVPVKAHGLIEVRKLIEVKSPVIGVEQVLGIHLRLLKNSDPFVYLEAIRGLAALCSLDAPAVVGRLVEVYTDHKRQKIDDILKVGEALTQYVQQENELFRAEPASLVINGCILNIQDRSGSIDDRVRMSSMSILGTCVQASPHGVAPHAADMLDCAIGILMWERDATNARETSFIMRRSALHFLVDAVTHLNTQALNPQKLWDSLEYLRAHEKDDLALDLLHTVQQLLTPTGLSLSTSPAWRT